MAKQSLIVFKQQAAKDIFLAQEDLSYAVQKQQHSNTRIFRRAKLTQHVDSAKSKLENAQDRAQLLTELDGLEYQPDIKGHMSYRINGNVNGVPMVVEGWTVDNSEPLTFRRRHSAALNDVVLTEGAANALAQRYQPILSVVYYNAKAVESALNSLGYQTRYSGGPQQPHQG